MAKKTKKSALQEIQGVSQDNRLNAKLVKNISLKKSQAKADSYVRKILEGNTVALSQAITLIESDHSERFALGQEIVRQCLPKAAQSIRIGITGVPGVGKSTFIEALGILYTQKKHKVAVLAVDPSSSLSKGSILGDKTRMEALSRDNRAYIRPSPTGNHLGGVARKTRESILLCEAAGFDVIIIETVGVGQSETIAHSMVDFFLLLKLAGAGDELQGIKRGIIEMADAIVINKAEADNLQPAKLAQKAFQNALHFYPAKESGWTPKVLLASALQQQGIDAVANEIDAFFNLTKASGYFEKHRMQQHSYWLKETIQQQLEEQFYQQAEIVKNLPLVVKKIEQKKLTAFEAAEILFTIYQESHES